MKAIVIGNHASGEDPRTDVGQRVRRVQPEARGTQGLVHVDEVSREVLSDGNRALLRVITETKPESISALAKATGGKPGNLSRTLKTMSNYAGYAAGEAACAPDCQGNRVCSFPSSRLGMWPRKFQLPETTQHGKLELPEPSSPAGAWEPA